MSTLAWPLLLLAFGLILLIAEVFIPSGGLIGFLALCCLGLSLWQAFQQSIDLGLKFLLADCLLLPVAMALAIHLWPRTPLARRVFLTPPTPEEIEVSHSSQRLDHLVGPAWPGADAAPALGPGRLRRPAARRPLGRGADPAGGPDPGGPGSCRPARRARLAPDPTRR